MTGTGIPQLPPQFFDLNGNPANGYKLFVYNAGTATKVNTWQDEGLTSLNTNPIILDTSGICAIFLDAGSANTYKFVLAPPTDTDPPTSPIWSRDGIRALAPASNFTIPRVDIFDNAGTATWTKPTGATYVTVLCVGGGGGGGSGRKGAAGSERYGGGGGGGGAFNMISLYVSQLGASETVTVGAAGTGGALVTANDTNGNVGIVGGASSFGTWVRASGGSPGTGGTNAAGTGGVGGANGLVIGGDGAAGSNGVGGTGTAGKHYAAGGGGGGGGVNAANVQSAGGSGGDGALGQASPNTGGVPGGDGGDGSSTLATGGGGGGGATAATGLAGGIGGIYGGGGGGGGAGINAVSDSGPGGRGEQGVVIVITT